MKWFHFHQASYVSVKLSSSWFPWRFRYVLCRRGGGWSERCPSAKASQHSLQAKACGVIFIHLIYINQPTCYPVPKSLMYLIKSPLLSHRDWAHTCPYWHSQTQLSSHMLFVQLKKSMHFNKWHLISARACVSTKMFLTFYFCVESKPPSEWRSIFFLLPVGG